jgi:hypothetical protein
MAANNFQVGGDHYAKNAIQPWDYIVANELGYLEGNIVKYITRWRDKGGLQDIDKVIHYAQKLKEVETLRNLKEEYDGIQRTT